MEKKHNSPGLRQMCVQIPNLLLLSWVPLDKDSIFLTLVFLICKMRIALVFTLFKSPKDCEGEGHRVRRQLMHHSDWLMVSNWVMSGDS